MAEHDKHEKDMLKSLQSIARSLRNIDKDLKLLYGLSEEVQIEAENDVKFDA